MKRANNFVRKACFIMTCLLIFYSCNNRGEDVEEVKRPKANFSFEVDKEAKLSVHFKNESQNYSSLSWDFGDKSGKSNEENPTYTCFHSVPILQTESKPKSNGASGRLIVDWVAGYSYNVS